MKIIYKSISIVIGLLLGAGVLYASRTPTLFPMILIPVCLVMFLTGVFFPRVGIGLLFLSIPFPSSYLYFGLPWFSWTLWFFLAYLAGYLLRGRQPSTSWTGFEWAGCALLALLIIHTGIIISSVKLNSVYSSYFIAKDGRRGALAYLLYAAQQDPWFSIRIVLGWITGLSVYYLLKETVSKKNTLYFYLAAFVGGSIIPLVFGLYQCITGYGMEGFWLSQGQWRINSLFSDPNSYGAYLLFIIPVTLGLRLYAPGDYYPSLNLLLLLQVISLILTHSATSIVVLGFELVFALVLLCYYKNRTHRMFKIMSVGLASAIGFLLIFPFIIGLLSFFFDKHSVMGFLVSDTGLLNKFLNGRVNLWVPGFKMFAAHPFFGVGPGQFFLLFEQFRSPVAIGWNPVHENAHSYFLQFAAENGILGLMIVISLFYLVFRNIVRTISQTIDPALRNLKIMLLVALAGIIMNGTINHPMLLPEFQFLFWGFAGILMGFKEPAVAKEPEMNLKG